MSDQKRINGNIVSWASIKITLGGEQFYGFVGVTYGDKRDRVHVYGMGKHHKPRARTRGKYSTDPVKLKGPKSTMQALRDQLAALSANGLSYGDVEFPISVQYLETGDTEMYVEIERCVYVGESSSEDESPDPLMEEIEIDCMGIRRNGKTLYDSEEGAP